MLLSANSAVSSAPALLAVVGTSSAILHANLTGVEVSSTLVAILTTANIALHLMSALNATMGSSFQEVPVLLALMVSR